jgi:rod shape-determining protein MreD
VRWIGSFIVILAVTLLLRSTALTALAARGVLIDVLAFATVVWALRHGESWGTGFGFALGLAADLDAAHWLGRHALVLALIGYLVGRASRSLVRESPRTQAVLVFVATFVHQMWVGAFDYGAVAAWTPLVRRVLLAAAVTGPVGALLLYVIRRAGGQPLFGHAALKSGPPV